MVKQIPLTQGKFALVDDEDYEFLMNWKWHFLVRPNDDSGYAQSNTRNEIGRKVMIYMHRLIMKTPKGMEVDHRDTNKLNNQKYNLRNVTRLKNSMNRESHKDSTSKHKGVCWDKSRNKWLATIKANNRRIFLGRFDREDDAGLAYDIAAIEYFKEFAHLNFPEVSEIG